MKLATFKIYKHFSQLFEPKTVKFTFLQSDSAKIDFFGSICQKNVEFIEFLHIRHGWQKTTTMICQSPFLALFLKHQECCSKNQTTQHHPCSSAPFKTRGYFFHGAQAFYNHMSHAELQSYSRDQTNIIPFKMLDVKLDNFTFRRAKIIRLHHIFSYFRAVQTPNKNALKKT